MRIIILAVLGLLLSHLQLFSQISLEIEITGLRNNTGRVMLQVFDRNEKVIAQEIGTIKDLTCSFTIRDLSPGKYAARFYHDENLNGEMETNLVGKPTEGYGFSNNVTGKFSMPPFEKWLFDVSEDKKISLKTNY